MNKFPIENIDKVAAAVNADSASKATQLANSKSIKLTGDASGSASFNGTADASITVTVADDSHNHVISNIDNLQSTLDAKGVKLTVSGKTVKLLDANDNELSSITTQDTNTKYSNMTAATADAAGKAGLVPAPAAGAQAKFLRGDATWQTVSVPSASSTTPKAAGTAAVGTGTTWARADHVHPAQTSVTGSSGSCTGNAATATSATKATQDESGNNIKASYAASMSISGGKITLKNKNGGTLSEGTVSVSSATNATNASYATQLSATRYIYMAPSIFGGSGYATNAVVAFNGGANASFYCEGKCTGCTGCGDGCSSCATCGGDR